MENATKALLIAAAVLIAIVIVALGVNLLASTGDTAEKAEQVGGEIKDSIGNASANLTDYMSLDLKRLYDKLGKPYPDKIDDFSKQIEKVYLCRYDGSKSQAETATGSQTGGDGGQVHNLITGKTIDPYFSVVPVKLTTNDVYNKVIEIIGNNTGAVAITNGPEAKQDDKGKWTTVAIVACTGIAHP